MSGRVGVGCGVGWVGELRARLEHRGGQSQRSAAGAAAGEEAEGRRGRTWGHVARGVAHLPPRERLLVRHKAKVKLAGGCMGGRAGRQGGGRVSGGRVRAVGSPRGVHAAAGGRAGLASAPRRSGAAGEGRSLRMNSCPSHSSYSRLAVAAARAWGAGWVGAVGRVCHANEHTRAEPRIAQAASQFSSPHPPNTHPPESHSTTA